MANKSSASEMTRLVNQLRQERQHHIDSINEIDQTFKEFGITADGTRGSRTATNTTKATRPAKARKVGRKTKPGRKAKSAAADSTSAIRKGPGRPKKVAAPTKKTTRRRKKGAIRAAAAPHSADKKPKSRRGRKFPVSGDELILNFVKDKGNATTEEIRNHWLTSSRKGKAENNLTNLVKSGKIKRNKVEGKPGSSYSMP